VADEVGAQLAVGQLPDLDQLVPARRHDEWVRCVRGEGDTGDPLGVALALRHDGVLAFTEGVPQLDGLVAGSRHNLPVVGREGHREDILLVSDKSASGETSVQVPKAEGAVP